MSCARPLVLALALCTAGCTFLDRIDTCDPTADVDSQLNATAAGDQYPTFGRSVVALPSGQLAAVWLSDDGTSNNSANQVRAGLFNPDGSIVQPCGSITGDTLISVDANAFASRPAIAVGTTSNTPIFIAWRTSAPGNAGNSKADIVVRLMKQDLCPYNDDGTLFTVSKPDVNTAAPALAVRSDGLEALVAWVSLPAVTGTGRAIHTRPIGIANLTNGQVEANGCDLNDAPCTNALAASLTSPAMTAFRDGYALAWPQLRDDGNPGLEVHLQTLDAHGATLSSGITSRPTSTLGDIHLALAATGSQVLLAFAGQPEANGSDPDDDDVFFERFDDSLQSQGQPAVINVQMQGVQSQPALALLPGGSLFATWASNAAGTTEMFGRIVDASGQGVFTGLTCDASEFPLPSNGPEHSIGGSLALTGNVVVAVFGDNVQAKNGSDALGLSVHARRFDLTQLAPSVK